MMCAEMFSLVGYEVVGLIGQGGIGDVYQARQLSTGATVAVKVLREIPGESASLHRLQRELEALTTLGGQSNVIRLLDVVDSDVGPALVMEFAPGGAVAALMAERGTVFDTDEVVFIGEQTAAALAAAHLHGIVHRDVKPQNLLIDAYGAVKLCDFGIAALTRSEQFQTRTTALSVRYASPEDLEQDAEVGSASDVYSLGATLLHLAHGAPPTLRERVQSWRPPGRDDPFDAELDEIIAACLQPNPTLRPSAAAIEQRLNDLSATISPRRKSLNTTATFTSAPASGNNVVDAAGARHDREGDRNRDGDSDRVPVRPAVDVQPEREYHFGAGVFSDAASDLKSDPRTSQTSNVMPALTPPAEFDHTGPAVFMDRVRRPDHHVSNHRHIWFAAVAALVALIAFVGWRISASDKPVAPPEATSQVRTTVARAGGSVDLSTVPIPQVAVGDCLIVEGGLADEAATVRVVPCAEVHDGEVFAVDRLPATFAEPFDATGVAAAATELCNSSPQPVVDAGIAVLSFSPTPESWESGDRRLLCLLAAPDARLAGIPTG